MPGVSNGMTAPWLVLAVGNPSRGDDALGPELIERLSLAEGVASDVEFLIDFQLQVEHALDLKGRHGVLFVDAARPGVVAERRPFDNAERAGVQDNSAGVVIVSIVADDQVPPASHPLRAEAVLQVTRQLDDEVPPACRPSTGKVCSKGAYSAQQGFSMCVVYGCGETNVKSTLDPSVSPGEVAPVVNASTGDLHFGVGSAKVSVPGMSEARTIKLESDVLGENARLATINRNRFFSHGVTAYDLVSSPGSGKTTLLCTAIAGLTRRVPSLPLAVIEGDQQTSLDADRMRKTGISAIQVNAGKGCHLDARMVGAAFNSLHLHAVAHPLTSR